MLEKPAQPPDKPVKRRKNAKQPVQEATTSPTAASDPKEQKQSCAECRRMKIKCDRVFPCKTCIKRGLEGICPEGSLVTGRGTRYVLASTEELHTKIEKMGDRIKILEEALGNLHREHAACPTVPPTYLDQHPLLQGDQLLVKGQMDLYGIDPARAQSAEGDNPDNHESTSDPYERASTSRDAGTSSGRLPSPNASESESPTEAKRKYMMDVDEPGSIDVKSQTEKQRFLRSLVRFPKDETLRLYQVAVRNFGWLLNCPEKPGYVTEFINRVYDESAHIEPQHVALVLAALAAGARLDFDTERCKSGVHSNASGLDTKSSQLSLELYRSAKQALAGAPVQSKPDYCTLLAVFTLAWYLAHLTDFKDAGRQAWIMSRLAVKMGNSLGLHRESTYKSIPVNERFETRLLFWNIVQLESRLEILSGRSMSSTRKQIACTKPVACAPSSPRVFSSRFEAIYHDYKLRFMDDVTYPIIEAISNARKTRVRSTDYNDVLDLDGRIRDYPIPAILSNWFYHSGAAPFRRRPRYTKPYSSESYAQGETAGLDEKPDCPPHVSTLIRCLVFQQMAIGLLQLHLPYAHCHIRDHRTVTQRRFMPSAIAAFSASVSLVESTRKVYEAESALATRVSGFWYNAFCSATFLFVLVVLKPFCPVAVLAIQELEKARNLFCAASSNCYMAARSFPILREFYAKAKQVYDRWGDATAPQYAQLPVKVPDQTMFGSDGAVILCQNRIDLIIREIQRVPASVNEDDEAAATAGLLDLNRAPHTFDERTSFTMDGRKVSALQKLDRVAGNTLNAPSMDVDEPESPASHTDETFYDMWAHTHEEICDFVRRVPEVLRDAQVEPRIATAARLIWGIVPPKPTNLKEIEKEEEKEAARLRRLDDQNLNIRPRRVQVPNELDWDSITDALMYISPATTHASSATSLSRSTSGTSPSISPSILSLPPSAGFANIQPGKDILLTPPSTTGSGSPVGANASVFPMLEACAPIDALYEPMDPLNLDVDAMDSMLVSYAMDGATGSAFVWPPPQPQHQHLLPQQAQMLSPVNDQAMTMQAMRTRTIDRCSYGGSVAKDETVGGVYDHFGRSPYMNF